MNGTGAVVEGSRAREVHEPRGLTVDLDSAPIGHDGRAGRVGGLDEQVEHTLELVDLVNRADTPVSDLAYGEKRRLEVGLALATSPSLLLLDEPLAGMSPRERVETVRLLKSIAIGRTMIIIDHDMDSLFELAQRVTVLQEGRVLIEGTPDEIKGNSKVQEAYLGGVHDVLAAE